VLAITQVCRTVLNENSYLRGEIGRLTQESARLNQILSATIAREQAAARSIARRDSFESNAPGPSSIGMPPSWAPLMLDKPGSSHARAPPPELPPLEPNRPPAVQFLQQVREAEDDDEMMHSDEEEERHRVTRNVLPLISPLGKSYSAWGLEGTEVREMGNGAEGGMSANGGGAAARLAPGQPPGEEEEVDEERSQLEKLIQSIVADIKARSPLAGGDSASGDEDRAG